MKIEKHRKFTTFCRFAIFHTLTNFFSFFGKTCIERVVPHSSPVEIRFDLEKNCTETKFGGDVQKGVLGTRKKAHRNPPMETGLTGIYM